jgi:serine kinase of HPr protein (carbohydrate metabolism regulator)
MINIHASCVLLGCAGSPFGAPGDAGVLLIGESGSGKSDLALRLIASGAILVADDRCDLFLAGDELRVRAPQSLRGAMEIRGIGIVTMPSTEEASIRLVVRLVAPAAIARFPAFSRYRPNPELGLPERFWPPEIAVAPFEASAPAKIGAAMATNFGRFGA